MNDFTALMPEAITARSQLIGVERAWPVAMAAEVLASLEGSEVAILGGDMYEWKNSRWAVVLPNWSTNIEPGEPWRAYAQRSREYTAEFLRATHWKDEWFVLVATSKPDAEQLAKSYAR